MFNNLVLNIVPSMR